MEYKPEKHLSAYERRKINSQKIAQVQFEPKWHKSPEPSKEDYYKYAQKKHQQFEREMNSVTPKKSEKPIWTSVDQKIEEQLWDE